MKSLKFLIVLTFAVSSFHSFSQQGWYKLPCGTNAEIKSIVALGSYSWAVGAGGLIIRTTNGGLNWAIQNSGTTGSLNSIIFAFRPDTVGYIVGDNGKILRSTNSGESWLSVNSGTTANLNAVCSLMDTISILAVGDNGKIVRSSNTGLTWFNIPSQVSSKLNFAAISWPYGVFIAGDGGKILHSYDEGYTWYESVSGTTNDLLGIAVSHYWNPASKITVIGKGGTILRSTNNGENWVSLSSGTTQDLKSIASTHLNSDTLYYYLACGTGGTMIESTDGINWNSRGVPFTDNLNCITLQDMNSGYGSGANGTIIKSSGNYFYADSKLLDANTISTVFRNDGGFNMLKSPSSAGFEWPKGSGLHARYASGLWLGAMVNNEVRVATAQYDNEYYPGFTDAGSVPHGRNDTNYRIFKMISGSPGADRQSWPNSLLGNSDQGAPVYYDSNSSSWKPLDFGSQTMFYSYTDSYAESHINYFGGMSLPLKADIKQLNFSVDMPGALGNTVFSQYTIINRSADVWNDLYITLWSDDDLGDGEDDKVGCDSSLGLGYTYNSENVDPVYGTAPPAVGFLLLKGAYLYSGSSNDTAVFCRNKQKTTLTGYRDLGMKSFNFAINGDPTNSDPNNCFETYNLLKGLYLDGNTIYHPDGFVTTLPFSGDPISNTGWVAPYGADFRLYVTTGPVNMNPGDTQIIVTAQIIGRGINNKKSIDVLKTYSREIKDYYANCYSTDPMGISEEHNYAVKFSLEQNYPNPFNPVTVIKYSIPFESMVTIKIFDITGKEVYTMNGSRIPGSYETRFDGSNLASGVYFYTIQAISDKAAFNETKKMVLLK